MKLRYTIILASAVISVGVWLLLFAGFVSFLEVYPPSQPGMDLVVGVMLLFTILIGGVLIIHTIALLAAALLDYLDIGKGW